MGQRVKLTDQPKSRNWCWKFKNVDAVLLRSDACPITLYFIEMPFDTFANKADTDQAALSRAA